MAHSLLHADVWNALEMLDHAARLRANGDSFDLALRLDDDRGSVAAVLAQSVCRAHPLMNDERIAALDKLGSPEAAIGDNPLLRFATMDLATKATMRDLAALADRLIVRSWAEMRRGVMDYDIVHRAYTIAPPSDERVPAPVQRKASDGSIVIWAPDEPVERLYLVLTAAAQTGRHVRVVAKPGDLAGIPAELIAPESAASALASAAVCVLASLSDPSGAIELAAWHIPVCATFTSGAHEWIAPVVSYRSWSRSSAFEAITQAVAMPAPAYAPSTTHSVTTPMQSKSDALVTVVVRSQRSSVQEATQRSIELQTHSAHELVVADSAHAVREALATAKGRYIVFLEDGDVLFSDHLASLVDALEQSQAATAYCGGLLAYLVGAPGVPTVLGYSVMEKFPVTHRAFAALDEFSGTYFRVLFRREQLQQTGISPELDGLAIFDAFSRMLSRHDAAHVDRVGGLSFRLLDGRTPGAAPHDYRAGYETYYSTQPAADPAINEARAAVLRHLKTHSQIALRPPPQRLNPPCPF